ncbi:hypothetical protein LINPERPRIM_LOCUS25108 [Linum perenne]
MDLSNKKGKGFDGSLEQERQRIQRKIRRVEKTRTKSLLRFPLIYLIGTSVIGIHHRLDFSDKALGVQIDAPAKDGEADSYLLDYISVLSNLYSFWKLVGAAFRTLNRIRL